MIKPKLITKSKNISVIKNGPSRPTTTPNKSTTPLVKQRVPIVKSSIPVSKKPVSKTTPCAQKPTPLETPREKFTQFALDNDPVIEKVLELECRQRTRDPLLDDVESRKTQTPSIKPTHKIDRVTGKTINKNVNLKSHVYNQHLAQLDARQHLHSQKLKDQEIQARMGIFRGLPDSECIPITNVPDIRTLSIDDIPAFCLHLPDRSDREPFMSENLPKIHSSVQCIPGVKFQPSYKAISRAHKRIIAIAKAKGWPYVITIEDDIRIPSLKAKAAFSQAMKNLPDDWDALLGGVYDCKTYKNVGNGLAEVKGWCSLHLVLWKHTMYDDILNHHEKFHIDRYIGAMNNKKFYLTWPFVAIQYNGFSDNVNMDVNYDNYLNRFKILS